MGAANDTRRLRSYARRIPTAGWVCALVALLTGTAWSLLIPLFHVPDEQAHFSYAQYVAEAGKPPTGRAGIQHFSEEQRLLLDTVRWKYVIHRGENRPPSTATAKRRLERAQDARLDRESEGGYTTATNNPPLYYGAAAGAYLLSPSTAPADRIHLMRLLSALLGAVTVLFTFLFLRELLPGTPWAWTVGALAVAFQPVFGFISGGVNSDNMLYAASAGVFLGIARCFRHELTPRRGLWIGGCAAVGLLSKINMLGLLPGIALGLLLLVLRADSAGRRNAARGALAAAGVTAGSVIVYMAVNSTIWDRGLFFGAGGVQGFGSFETAGPANTVETQEATLGGALNYLWQFYLPKLPFMDAEFTAYQARQVWLDGFIGAFGWLDYTFPRPIYDLGLALLGVILVLAGRELVLRRARLHARLGELVTYCALAAGLIVFVNVSGYIGRLNTPLGFEQARYLFPLLPLYGTIVALAVRGAGRRYGPAAGILVVSVAIAHTAVAMVLALTRYYG